MFKNIAAKIFNNDGNEVGELETSGVVIEALCAYRDQLIMSEENLSLETQSKLVIIRMVIDDVLSNRPVK